MLKSEGVFALDWVEEDKNFVLYVRFHNHKPLRYKEAMTLTKEEARHLRTLLERGLPSD